MYKVWIDKRIRHPEPDCNWDIFYSTISWDATKPEPLSDEEWYVIKEKVEQLAKGDKEIIKELPGPNCRFDLHCIFDDKDHGILAVSEHYYILREYEDASLYRKGDSKYITSVGDFYGDPDDAYIDPEEKFCMTIGCGIIKYNLVEPFEGYMYDRNTAQWVEVGREGDIEWCDKIEEITDSYIIVSLEGEEKRKFDINTLEQLPI